ncbi:MAG: hypothetical protein QXR60_02300 [Candidatus Nanoarchaeia archaeon]
MSTNTGLIPRSIATSETETNEKGEVYLVKDAYFSELNKKGVFEYVKWKGVRTNLNMSDIKSVTAKKAGGIWDFCDILFRNGNKDEFEIKMGSLIGKVYIPSLSKYGDFVQMMYDGVKVEVLDSMAAAPSSSPQAEKFDQIVLKNGDVLSGDVLTGVFFVKTSYGKLELNARDIQTINFEGGGLNIDVVTLRMGDKLSGVVHSDKITIRLRTGAEMSLDKDKVKDVIFKQK